MELIIIDKTSIIKNIVNIFPELKNATINYRESPEYQIFKFRSDILEKMLKLLGIICLHHL
jgi:hypothetical protein